MTTGIATPQANLNATQTSWIARHPLLTMYLIMFGVEFTNATLYILYERGLISFKTPDAVMFVMSILHPAVAAAVVTVALSGRKGLRELLSRFLIWRVSGWWYVFIFAFYAIDMLAGNSLNSILGGPKSVLPVAGDPLWQIPIKFVIFLLFAAVINTEEIAWRGVALPLLKSRYGNALVAALLVAIPEALLHAPDYFVSEMNFRKAVGALMFTIFTIALSVIFAWVFLNTKGSLLIVTLFHASGNAWSNMLTDNTVQPFYYSIGIIVLFAVAVVLIYGPKNLSRQANE